MNDQVLPVSRGKKVWCKSKRYAISLSDCFGFVDSVPPFYLNMRLCAVQLNAYVFSVSDKMNQPTFTKFDILVV